jgi:inosine/guanosine/xanthosine phosphorylase family protein
MTAGTIMLIADHLNLTGRNPLVGPVRAGETRFPDMANLYDAALRAHAKEAARRRDIALAEGVYAGVLGPSYETPAEIRMLARLGADAVGMSTVIEAIAAAAAGMRCLGISVIANYASGVAAVATPSPSAVIPPATADAPPPLSHAEVLRAAEIAAERLGDLLEEVVTTLPRAAPRHD